MKTQHWEWNKTDGHDQRPRTNLINSIQIGIFIKCEAPIAVQLKREIKLLTVTGLNKYVICRVISDHSVMGDYFPELYKFRV